MVNSPSGPVEAPLRVPSITTLTPGIVSPVDWSRTTPVMVPPKVCEKELRGSRIVTINKRLNNCFFILMADLNTVQKSAADVTGV